MLALLLLSLVYSFADFSRVLGARVVVHLGVPVQSGAARPSSVEQPCFAHGAFGDCASQCPVADKFFSSDADEVFGWCDFLIGICIFFLFRSQLL